MINLVVHTIQKIKSVEEVVKNARQVYETRNDIINTIEGVEEKKLNFDWLRRSNVDELKELIEEIKSNNN